MAKPSMKVGDVFPTNNNSNLVITKYESAKKVWYRFLDTGYESHTAAANIRRGGVRDVLAPSVAGVGYIGEGPYLSWYPPEKNPYLPGKERSPAYEAWSGMLKRCYCKKSQERRPTYAGVEVDERWHNFQVFAKWYYSQDWRGKELDKDLLTSGSKKRYGPDTCVLISPENNTAINRVGSIFRAENVAGPERWRVLFSQTFSTQEQAIEAAVNIQLSIRHAIFAKLKRRDSLEGTIREILTEQIRSRTDIILPGIDV
ncbi:hypothetical protein [Photobacterium lipolyticum]|uniref:Uncharacterized protein n=1 Tax=Photobacterium lipolyticum TaxID=266810 RepID=A0A2T3N151_9GAMM|nr:hypothetical protein [Photobacterium lipolyticum]PSW06057.1 hypothetical protein C9I89_05960 [Photobacterium lipolyticum]